MIAKNNNIINKLNTDLGYKFQHDGLLQQALSHRSAQGHSNERLEFLGDSILNFVIAEALFEQFPHADEGALSRLRASLVKGATLAEIAVELSIGDYLRLGPGEQKNGGHRRTSILADAVEAIFGAVYLDSSFTSCRTVILRLFCSRLQQLPPVTELKDPKTRLQEHLQASQHPLPQYRVVNITGADHQQKFTVECAIDSGVTTATATSRRKAEQAAACKALQQLL